MKLFIKYEDGIIVDHPVIEDNLRSFYNDFDPVTNNYNYIPFYRAAIPTTELPYTVIECVYQHTQNAVQEVYTIRAMTAQEKQQWIDSLQPPYEDWIFDEPTAKFKPPVAYPQDGQKYGWDSTSSSWNLV